MKEKRGLSATVEVHDKAISSAVKQIVAQDWVTLAPTHLATSGTLIPK